jgi:demethylmenaquinone methyltransferase/2-methoxy-6-polyprenyl-1,4-benzoquinol methylase
LTRNAFGTGKLRELKPTDDAVLREQLRYYSQRADEYHDDAYLRHMSELEASWRDEMLSARTAFDALPLDGDIVELAAGTGAWTERLVERARSLTVLDGSPEMLDRNQKRLGAAVSRVTYEVVDLFDWNPPRTWDACVFGFWLCKVPDGRVDAFARTVAQALRPRGLVCCVDKAASAEPPTELEDRTLSSGRQFTIIDHPRPPSRIVEIFRGAGIDVGVQTFGSRFCLAFGAKT